MKKYIHTHAPDHLALKRLRIERNLPNMIMGIYEISTRNIVFNGERLKGFSPRLGKDIHLSPLLSNIAYSNF